MELTREKVDVDDEKKIAIGCIVSTDFVRSLMNLTKTTRILKSTYIRKVVTWCFDYYKKYNESPKGIIQDIFTANKTTLDESVYESIELLLAHINERYLQETDTYNTTYHLNNAKIYLRRRQVEETVAKTNGLLLSGRIDEAEMALTQHKIVKDSISKGINLAKDPQAVAHAFSKDMQSMLYLPGALGELIGPTVYRGDVFIVGGAQKKGKSSFMGAFGKYGWMQGLNVVEFSLEMNVEIRSRRHFQDLTGETAVGSDEPIDFPYFRQDGTIGYRHITKGGLDKEQCYKTQKKLGEYYRGGYYLFTPNESGDTIAEFDRTLEYLAEVEDFIPDVIIVDYLDICSPEKGSPRDDRGRINFTYMKFKKLVQKWSAWGVSGTQLLADVHERDAKITDVSDDKRKLSHLSHLVLLNQTPEEKRANLMRLTLGLNRHRTFSVLEEIVLLQCPSINRFILDSRRKDDISNYEEAIKQFGKGPGYK